MTLTVQSVQFVGSGMLIEQISCGANVMLIGSQDNVSLILVANLIKFNEKVHQQNEELNYDL